MPQTAENILLAKVVYDIYSVTPTQTFPVPKIFSDLGITTRTTTFRFLSNWGSDVTCIYRVRVSHMFATVPKNSPSSTALSIDTLLPVPLRACHANAVQTRVH